MTNNAAFAIVAITVCLGVLIPLSMNRAGLFSGEENVPAITATELRKRELRYQALVAQSEKHGAPEPTPDFVLVDVRADAEVKVSVIPGAITAEQFERSKHEHRNRTVICYCTVGFRSEKYARKLRDQGFDAWNFQGSLLEWCAEQYPLETLDHRPTRRVHTYSSEYSVPPVYEAVW